MSFNFGKCRRGVKLLLLACVLLFVISQLQSVLRRRGDFESESVVHDLISVVERSRLLYGIVPLRPSEDGVCWFHGQLPHAHDREVFKRLGGKVSGCKHAPVVGARYTSEAEICDCSAPSVSEFSKHFLEIGSADGQYLSNLLFFEMQMNWRGVCVEGSPSSFALLKANRPECITVNAVIGADEGEKLFYTFDSPSSWEVGMSCMQGMSCGKTDQEAQAYANERKLKLKKNFVKMRRLSDIFAENNLIDFGWVMVDVEGAEDLVIPTIDLSSITAKFISYEGNHEAAARHLEKGGYEKSFQVGPDVFYEHV